MRIVVCIKQTAAGELNPFDACAYEAALQLGGEVILLSMAPEKSREMLLRLTRLGAKEAYLLCDKAFAGADTLATAYTLSLAVKKLAPDLVICGRQTVDGDTAQTGPALSAALGYSLITNVMSVDRTEETLTCTTRTTGQETVPYPALITVERINTLRLPSIRSKPGTVITWSAEDLQADLSRCGLKGSPTKVLKSFENQAGKRKCTFVAPEEFDRIVAEARAKKAKETQNAVSEKKIQNLWIVGESPRFFAETVADRVTVVAPDTPEAIAERAKAEKPDVILWGSDPWSKRTAPLVAWMLQTGLCADCTKLETDGETLFMYRPAFSGNVIAKIACVTRPQMATVRTAQKEADLIFAFGKGARDVIGKSEEFAAKYGAQTAASRAAVDTDLMPYEKQVGLTGKTVVPAVYVAFGISGAVHHIAGMDRSGTVVAVNKDKDAPIFEYADYGIIADVNDIVS